MTEAVFAGSMPSIYDRCLGNGRFRPFAVDLVSRVPVGPPGSSKSRPAPVS